MCLAIPAEVTELRDGGMAVVNLGGVRKEISIALVPEAKPGDYVVVHVGYALSLIDAREAAKTLALFEELAEMERQAAISASGGLEAAE
jgi:hydrogenase expression/formation protein HypC